MGKKRKRPQRRLLDAAREYQDALEAAGLPPRAIESYEVALRGVESQARAIGGATQVLVREIQREVEEFQAVFKAHEPIPQEPRELLALGRAIVKEAPDYAQNMIKYAINAATVKHLAGLCDQLEKELK